MPLFGGTEDNLNQSKDGDLSEASATQKSQSDSSDSAAVSVLRADIDQIISAGTDRSGPTGSRRSVFLAALLTSVALWLSFTPVEAAPLAWIALVPLSLLIRIPNLPKRSYRVIYLAGMIWAVATVQWMRLGHPAMYGAVAAMGIYLAFYFPAFVVLGRAACTAGLPVWLVCGLVWTSLEFLRAYLLTGFPWYFLGHSQYQFLPLVQISDLTGAYGVTFVLACFSGCVAGQIPSGWLGRMGLAAQEKTDEVRIDRPSFAIASCLLLLAASYGYGVFRLNEVVEAQDGPVIALAQGNFTPEAKHDPDKWQRMVIDHDLLTRRAAGLRPDLIVWPETMFPVPDRVVTDGLTDEDLTAFLPPDAKGLNSNWAAQEISSWRDQQARMLLTNRSQEAGASMMVGLLTEVASDNGRQRFNSAAFLRPDVGYMGRYDKIHRVIFGEYIPLRSVFPWLAKVTPFGAGFGIDAGNETAVFDDGKFTFAPIICFEDTVPHLVRQVVNTTSEAGKSPDVLVNMTNDGWFRGSSELDQHLITATFRCIETRRPMVRAVNAGISAFIDSSGRIRQPQHFQLMTEETATTIAEFKEVDSMIDPETGKRYRQVSALLCAQVPLDGRSTVYLQWGDWFGWLVSLAVLLGAVRGVVIRRRATASANV
ncbi:MAG: apolipoprotein N-acyltransferase [Fuerstiella sp.]